MLPDFFFELHEDLYRQGPGRDEYTRKAFELIPHRDHPRILDIGCGPGGQTMELARLTNGTIIALDIHQPFLDEVTARAVDLGFADRITTINKSMTEMDFPTEHFDIIWSEGSIYNIGFEKGLKEWRRLIKPGGCLAVHEMTWLQPNPPAEIKTFWEQEYPAITTIDNNIAIINKCGYDLLGHFPLPEDAWWEFYYNPLQQRLNQYRKQHQDDPEKMEIINWEQREIDLYKKYNQWYGSVFYVMKKPE